MLFARHVFAQNLYFVSACPAGGLELGKYYPCVISLLARTSRLIRVCNILRVKMQYADEAYQQVGEISLNYWDEGWLTVDDYRATLGVAVAKHDLNGEPQMKWDPPSALHFEALGRPGKLMLNACFQGWHLAQVETRAAALEAANEQLVSMTQRFDTIWFKNKSELVTMAVDAGLGSWSAMNALTKCELQQFLKRHRDQQNANTEVPTMPKGMDKWTNAKLYAYTQQLGLTVPENYRKADLLFAVREHYEAQLAEAAAAVQEEMTTGLSPEEWTEIQQSGTADELMTWYNDLPERTEAGKPKSYLLPSGTMVRYTGIGAKVKSKPPARMAWIPPPSSSSSSGPTTEVPAKKAAALPKGIHPPPPVKSKGKGKTHNP